MASANINPKKPLTMDAQIIQLMYFTLNSDLLK